MKSWSLVGMDDFRISKSLSITDAVSTAVVDLVGNNSTHREKASMITSIYSLPCASLVNGPIRRTIEMTNFKWIVGRACESMSLDRDAQAIGNLTVRALSKKFLDHAVGDHVLLWHQLRVGAELSLRY